MSNWNRRSVLVSGISLSVGSGLASISAGSSGSDVDDLPDPALEPNPEIDEDWASYRGDAGHARYIDNGHEFDGESLEVAWTVDHNGSVAVADGTVYTTNEDGVVAFDAADGTIVWENQTVDANAPTVVGDTVYLTGSEVVALDRADGSVRWTSDFDPQESISKQTVAYEMVYVVVDGTLYALDTDDGSVVWENESVTDEASGEAHAFTESTAATNGVVYAATEEIGLEAYTLALEPETGDEVWRAPGFGGGSQPLATTAAVALDNMGYYQRTIQDPQTGEEIQQAATEYTGLSLGTEIFIGGDANGIHARLLGEFEDKWEKSVFYGHIGEGVISGETVYIYFPKDPSISAGGGTADYSQALVALDKYDGTEKWTLSIDEMPVGEIRAISGTTVYVDHDGELVALRDQTADEDSDSTDDTDGDTDNTDEESDDTDDSGGETDNTDDESDDTDEDTDNTDDGSGDTDNTDEESSDTGGDADDTGEDQSDEAGSDCPDEGTDSTCGEDNTETSTDNSESSIDSSETSADGDGGNTSNGNETDATDNETVDTNGETDDTDGTPGFTTGTGLLGGTLGLEWLRRRAGVDDPDE